MTETLSDAVHEKQPPVERDEAAQRREHDERPEEWTKYGGDGVDEVMGDHRRLEVQSEEWIRPCQLETGPVRGCKHAKRPELAVHEDPHVVFANAATERFGYRLGDFRIVTTAIGVFGNEIEQTRQLKDLAIRPPGEKGSLFESRIPVLAEQFDPVRKSWWGGIPG